MMSPRNTKEAQSNADLILDGTSIPKGSYSFMKDQNLRIQSFKTWPLADPTPLSLARAGFFYTKEKDFVECAFCGVRISEWKADEDPNVEHKKWSPSCPFVKNFFPVTMNVKSGKNGVHTRPNSLPENQAGCSTKGELEEAYPAFSTYEKRLRSFDHWPRCMKQNPKTLSEAGFFYTGCGDKTICHFCGGGLKDWDDNDDPWEEHANWFPKCHYLIKNRPPSEQKQETKSQKEETSEPQNGHSKDRTLCKICYEKDVGMVFVPCGHIVTCVSCSGKFKECPVCRKEIEKTLRAFLS